MLYGNNCCYLCDVVCFYISEIFFFFCRYKNDNLVELVVMWLMRKKEVVTVQFLQGRGFLFFIKEDIFSILENFGDSIDSQKENNNNK